MSKLNIILKTESVPRIIRMLNENGQITDEMKCELIKDDFKNCGYISGFGCAFVMIFLIEFLLN